jgi:uncharacterized protein (DUF58 family)
MKFLDATARRILDRVSLAIRPGATAGRQGGHRSPLLASGVEFADHRAYVPGDDVRHIDWKAFARNGQLTLRQFHEDRDARIYILCDMSGSMDRGTPSKLSVAKRLAAAFAYVGMRQFDRALVLPFGDHLERETRSVRTGADVPELERFLEGGQSGGLTSLPDVVREFATRHSKRGLVVLLTDLMTPTGFPEAFRTVGALGHELRVIHVRAREDLEPEVHGEIELVDAETDQTVRMRVGDALLAAYKKELATHLEGCRVAVRRAGGLWNSVDVADSPEAILRRAFGPGTAT